MVFEYPRLQGATDDYLNREGYSVELIQEGSWLRVVHRLADADCLPGQWLRQGVADFMCEIRAPYMLYCRRFDLQYAGWSQPVAGGIEVVQDLELPAPEDGRVSFLPGIVLNRERTVALSTEVHGVSALWHGRRIRFPKGAVVAGGVPFNNEQCLVHLLRFREDRTVVDPGVIRAGPVEEEEQWRFDIALHPDKMAAMQHEANRDWRKALYVGCLAQMLATIRDDFRGREPAYEALHVLAGAVRDKTGRRPPWETEQPHQDWGDTLSIATALHKLVTPTQSRYVYKTGHERVDRAREVLNPDARAPDPLSNLRNKLVRPEMQDRGGPAQVVFLQAVERNALLEYLENVSVGQEFASLGTPLLPFGLRESEFAKAPVATARAIRSAYRCLSPPEAASVSVWNVITLHNIQAGRLQAPYLAVSSDRITGMDRIRKALSERDEKQIDDCVRTVFRTMGGLHRIRGNVSVISDCTLARYWWIGRVLEISGMDEDRAWKALDRHWREIAQWAMRRLTVIGNPVLMRVLVAHITRHPVDTNAQMRTILKRISRRVDEVSVHSWSEGEVRALVEGKSA